MILTYYAVDWPSFVIISFFSCFLEHLSVQIEKFLLCTLSV